MKRYSQRWHGGGVLAELNITPLLDLCFVLLIIFMITTPLMEQQMEIKLPKARSNPAYQIDPKSIVQVSIDSKGVITANKHVMTTHQLEIYLANAMENNPDSVVALRADANLRYQELMDVLDVVKRSGARLGLSNTPDKSK